LNVQFRETDNITYTRRKMKTNQTEKKSPKKPTHNTICAKTNKFNKKLALLQTTHDHTRAVVRFKCIAKEQKKYNEILHKPTCTYIV
jgi:hypothetical protein